jgi:hypothetical protein
VKFYFTAMRMTKIKSQTIISADMDVEKLELPFTAGGNIK